jgi:hypothetical protein
MTDSTIDSEVLVLFNAFGGPDRVGHVPKDGFTGSSHHNVATAAYPLGTVLRVEQRGAAGQVGFSEFVYLKMGTQNADSVVAAKSVVVQDSATVPLVMTNDPDSCIAIPTNFGAYAISAMTNAYYGWFWCGGICPEDYVSGLGGTYSTNGSVVAGAFSYGDQSADLCGLVPSVATGTAVTGKVTAAGFALVADT